MPTQRPDLDFHPLTTELLDDFRVVLWGNWGNGCWCIYPRMTDAQMRGLPGEGSLNQRRRAAATQLAQLEPAPGLVAYEGNEAVGWVAIAPREQLIRVDRSRATPLVDDADVWVIPYVTVRKTARGRGIAVALIGAAVEYAARCGAPAVAAYPRAGTERTCDDNAYFGTEPMFRRAGIEVIRGPLENRPRNWVARVAMRTVTPPVETNR